MSKGFSIWGDLNLAKIQTMYVYYKILNKKQLKSNDTVLENVTDMIQSYSNDLFMYKLQC